MISRALHQCHLFRRQESVIQQTLHRLGLALVIHVAYGQLVKAVHVGVFLLQYPLSYINFIDGIAYVSQCRRVHVLRLN